MSVRHEENKILAEGKTKIVREVVGNPTLAILEAKDDITAGDGAKHDVIAGKAELATATTSNVFRLLKACGIPVAFREQLDAVRFIAEKCEMLPYEVVVRREAHGSYLKRHPYLKKGHVFPKLVLEFFLKTTGKVWQEHALPKDDPLIGFGSGRVGLGRAELYLPDAPIHGQQPFLALDEYPMRGRPEMFQEMGRIARQTFLVIEKAWQLLDRRLVDFKVEFGLNHEDELLLADVIDNDSWRVIEEGSYIDKQLYRDGASLDTVTSRYRQVAELTERFALPRQRIILWRGSEKDDPTPFVDALQPYGIKPGVEYDVDLVTGVYSAHKEPPRAYQMLAQLVQQVPDAVIIAYVGRSNGLGPTLAANTTVPVITVPASVNDFPDDVWSSLRMPSDVPVMTVLEPKNAVLAALQILAMRNPRLYAELRMQQEERFANIVSID